jgi:DNA invertase Pin-like site-specific DNA recombinase
LDQSATLEGQRQMIREYFVSILEKEGFAWGGFLEDATTAGNMGLLSRPAGSRLDLALEPGDVAIFARLERSFSCVRDAVDVIKSWLSRGIHVHIPDLNLDTSTQVGQVILRFLLSYSDSLRNLRSERAALSISHRRNLGRPVGGRAPYGLKCVGSTGNRQFAPDPFTRRIGKYVVKWKLAGHSFRDIYFHLLRHRERNRKGKEWSLTTLHSMFHEEYQLLQQERSGRSLLAQWRKMGQGSIDQDRCNKS